MKSTQMLLLGLGLVLHSASTEAQNQVKDTADYPYWIEMMKDPDANFFETQKAFNTYWKDREITRGSGYKQFRRWEARMERKVDINGNIIKDIHLYNAFINYQNRTSAKTSSKSGNWTQMGPFNPPADPHNQVVGLGRIASLAFDPTDANTMYTGAPSGGIWKTIDGGNNWTNISNNIPTLGVSAIIVTNNYILIGTGDRDDLDANGVGVMKSTDGGQTWVLSSTGMGPITVNRMVKDPTDDNIILAATTSGIYRSTDAGASWSLRQSGDVFDMVFKPNDKDVIYASTEGNQPVVMRSVDNGMTWVNLSVNFPPAARKAAVAVTPDDPDYLYVVVAEYSVFSGLYRSTDGGNSFTLRSNSPNLMSRNFDGSGNNGIAWYNLDVAVDPTDKDIVYVGGINIFKSTNGGTTWAINGHWFGQGTTSPAVHADNHVLEYSPLNGKLYTGNDGGVYETSNGGTLWTLKSNGLNIGQIYKIGQSTLSKGLVLGGYQDNGTSLYDHTTWTAVADGDGMECIVDPTDTNYMYAEAQNGIVRRSVNGGASFSIISSSIPGSGTWVTPYILDVTDVNTMYVGYDDLWRNDNVRSSNSWTKISNISDIGSIKVIEQSSADPDVMLLCKDFLLQVSTNAQDPSPTFTPGSYSPVPEPIFAIETHPTKSNVFYIATRYKFFKTTDLGNTWIDMTGSLPQFPFNTIVYDKSAGGESLYLGTAAGVFYRDSTMNDWIDFGTNLPPVDITELEIYYGATRAESRIRAATYGRGLWQSDLHSGSNVSLPENAAGLAKNSVKLFPNPATGVATVNIANLSADKVQMTIINVSGEVIDQRSLVVNDGFVETVVDLSKETRGVYFIVFDDGKNSVTREMIVN